jgi:hypothetical protein
LKAGGAYDLAVRVFSAVAVLLGAVLIVSTLARGGGPLSVGVLLGLAFVVVGVARLRLQKKIGERR